jgi:superfamily I DNA/RNA helicase
MIEPNPFADVLECTAPRICVIAAPGSGKTRSVLLPAIDKLIRQVVRPEEILLLSFSRVSAADLKKEVASVAPTLSATTVH